MSATELSSEIWYIKLTPYHFNFFKEMAEKFGDIERGAEARQCRKFLNETIIEYKRTHIEKAIE